MVFDIVLSALHRIQHYLFNLGILGALVCRKCRTGIYAVLALHPAALSPAHVSAPPFASSSIPHKTTLSKKGYRFLAFRFSTSCTPFLHPGGIGARIYTNTTRLRHCLDNNTHIPSFATCKSRHNHAVPWLDGTLRHPALI
jgi:hypothetical protein